ncbi:LOW QUALITY PROTEIN: chondroitin sulfate synthase 2-like [Pecten maximus]|uniref:LOW QUALITY PROTEIN: chondroitin sulfate synthase 2-like n=1 Tax=Pecten maximus TaxID=6579 RepID=UPI001457EB99|nr:LOW QUALITY PROTEIN: chondroitin sulfate synthase 2-like [Pecten maximus]
MTTSIFKLSSLRSFLPVLVGMCMGIALNMMIAPFFDEMCDPSKAANPQNVIELHQRNNNVRIKKETVDNPKKSESSFKIDPTVQQAFNMPGNGNPKKFVRPRFASTELGIKEKLFVAVLTSPNTINSFGLAVNKTLSHYVTKTIFFTATKTGMPPPGMPIVGFMQQHATFLPIHVLKYIRDHYANSFDYYMFITDRTYVRAEKIFELVSHISVSQDIYLGPAEIDDNGQKHCSIEGGLIISQSVIEKTFTQLDWCMMNNHVSSASITLGRCIHHTTAMQCTDHGGDKPYKYYHVVDFDFDDDIPILRNDARFNTSLSVYPMSDDISHYKVHRYFCQLELNLTKQEIVKAKENMVYLSQFGPGGRDSLTWPLGVSEAIQPKSRFDILRWSYFTDKDIYFDDDFTNVKKLIGADKADVAEITQTAFDKLNKENGHKYRSYSLINGYRKFEPARGLEYTVDLEVQTNNRGEKEIKRVHLLRPLNKVELVPMPYVTENTKVNLIVPVFYEDQNDFAIFMDSFSKAVLDNSDNTMLYILLVYKPADVTSGHDTFAVVKTTILLCNKQTEQEARIRWSAMETNSTFISEFEIIDRVVRDFPSTALLAIGAVGMELEQDYLNRVRMNTIHGWQVFFPISYWQYKQNLAYEQEPYPNSVEFGQKYGHFDVNSYEHSSFYVSDYLAERKFLSPKEVKQSQLLDMFLKNPRIHVFRATDPALRNRWKNITCPTHLHGDRYFKCLQRRSEGLASRAQLARLIFEQQEKEAGVSGTAASQLPIN